MTVKQNAKQGKTRAPYNRTLTLANSELPELKAQLLKAPFNCAEFQTPFSGIAMGDCVQLAPALPNGFFDLLFLDPPYNLTKQFGSESFSAKGMDEYEDCFEAWLLPLLPKLKETASVYACGDWISSTPLHRVLSRHLIVRNRITWEREKGRGALTNWKNSSEDIWFCTVSKDYYFDVEAVKLKRRVLAPYREEGKPKDWENTESGNFRLTHPSNLWTDITVPFWSMPENTDHPTQKPEKLVAKILLASTRKGDWVLDPFAGSGTTAVVAKKLGRNCLTIEKDAEYACISQKRLNIANKDQSIQGYHDGVFWERNSLSLQKSKPTDPQGELSFKTSL